MASFKIGKIIMRSLFKKPATLMYPHVPRQWQERTRGQIAIREADCIVCGICAKKCPANAIEVDRKERTWTIERMQCIQCNCCVEACPKKCLDMEPKYTAPGPEKIVDSISVPEQKKPAPKKPADGESADSAKEETAASTQEEDGLQCNLDDCIYCGLCAKECPSEALKVDRKEKVWEVDKDACTQCGLCVDKCPKDCLTL